MSWFDTTGIASFAKSALNTAQKTIDKALDINDEKSKISEHTTEKKADSDNFFEAFGLSEKSKTTPSSSTISTPNRQKDTDNNPQDKENVLQGSSFWPDTWGSFFEMQNPSVESSTTGIKSSIEIMTSDRVEAKAPSKPGKVKSAVLSQPSRITLFPDDSKEEDVISEQSLETTEALNMPETNFISPVSGTLTVTHQPVKEIPLDFDIPSKDSVLHEALTINSDRESISQTSTNITSCAPVLSEITISSSNNSTEDTKVYSEIESVAEVCDSNTSSCETKVNEVQASESTTIAESVTNNKTMCLGASSTESIEKVSDDDEELANPTIFDSDPCDTKSDAGLNSVHDVPQLPVNLTENVANWECNIEPIFDENDNQTLDLVGSTSTLVIESIIENQHWGIESDRTTDNSSSIRDHNLFTDSSSNHHFTDNSSNEERHSHHTDGSSNSSKDDDEDTDTAEVRGFDAKSYSSNESNATSSSSFVKCSVDENDNSQRGASPASTTGSKQESDQNSADEIETATSSDIEILTTNGENGDRNSSPLKHIWLSKALRPRRSESPTSDSSKDSFMPVVSEMEEPSYDVDMSAPISLYESTVRELTCDKKYSDDDLGRLLQKQDELQTILDAREKKIVELSKENIDLQENEQRLKNLMQKMRYEQANESKDITSLTREFSQRLALVEGQLKEAVTDRNWLQDELDAAKIDLSKRILPSAMEDVIKEKDQQIQELTEEGQKLSKKELTHTTIIKKLRAKTQDLEQTTKSQSEKIEENTKEVDRLRKSLTAKEDQEKKHIDAIRDLTNTVTKLNKEVYSLKSNLEDSSEKEMTLKKSLDTTYKDLTDLKKSFSSKEKEVDEFRSGLELQAQENLQQMLENAKKEAAKDKESLLYQMQDLRSTMSRAEEEANLREKMFKSEIAGLQKRLQEAEERNEDLTKNMSSATRPLVRQIENLQATFTTQTISWEKIEKNLTDRLSDAQNQGALLSEKERSATSKYLEYQSKVVGLESQNSSLRQEKLQVAADIESLKTNLLLLEDSQSRDDQSLKKQKQEFDARLGKLQQEKANIESSLTTSLEQLETEKKRVHKLEEEIKIKDARALIISGSSPCPSPTGSVRSSVGSLHYWSQDESHDQGIHTPTNNYRMSVYESLRLGSGSSILENLQSQLKQREGEIIQLQSEIVKLEHVKESMTRELVQLSEQNEELDKKLVRLESVDKNLEELNQKYNTLLQMYGEKVEHTEELKLDLADVKSMYKAQIEELLAKK